MANLIGERSVDWKKTADVNSKSSVDSNKTADFSGKWRLVEYDEESFLRFFEAMGDPDPRLALQFYKNAAQQEIIDKGDSVIINFPDPSAEGGQRKLDLTVGQEWVGKGPMGIEMESSNPFIYHNVGQFIFHCMEKRSQTSQIFATREGNKLMLESASPNGKRRHHAIYQLQGDKVLYDMKHHATGITARAVLVGNTTKP